MTESSPMLTSQGVAKHYGDHIALAPLDMVLERGKILGLLGPNGAGKTTFLRMVTGITRPDQGVLRLFGEPHRRDHLRRMGYLPEERGLYKGMRVAEQVLYFASLRGMSRTDAQHALKGWFERLQVEGWWNREVADLSKGMAQKIQFIATVLHRPELLILDEPFSGLDPINAVLIRDEMLRLVREEGTTLVLSTHNMGSVETLCEEVLMLHRGHKVLSGRVDEVRETARKGRIRMTFKGNLMAFVDQLGPRAELLSHESEVLASGETRHEVALALPEDWSMSALLRWAVDHVEVLEAVPVRMSMEEVFVQTVEANGS
ncbi:MAG: ATP-binding cassette domain-containing protein [Bacteroidetes bacterium]|nr:ATP-binding cassette domain-containing protein [Bacteroidota bacterium]MDA0903930.1 ATP-binding cassette domain-containing protein [Bacteroidota bacterium]MDA1242776.1 ATP-binding cassette domain-containing protein [Bacteroidota bacterium]